MGVNISDTTLTAGTNTLTISNNGNAWSWNAAGQMKIGNQPACQVGSVQQTLAGGYVILPSGWQTVQWSGGETTNRNAIRRGSRYYIETTGMYFLTAAGYMYNGTATSGYVHPLFSVNGNYGGTNGRGGAVSTTYRIRHYGVPNAGYFDMQISELKYLQTGDWVETVVYTNTTDTQLAFYYAFFGITLLG